MPDGRDGAGRLGPLREGLLAMQRVLVTVAAVLAVASMTSSAVSAAATERAGDVVAFEGAGGTTLHGTWVVPAAEPGDAGWPAMVLVHGSGRGERDELMPLAEEFAAQGIATLVYDKRTEGYSQFERDYRMLAEDAMAAVLTLRERDDIDPERVGVWGVSEGGWVAPLAASRSDRIDFVILVAANGGPPVEQEQWSVATALDHAGVRGSLVRAYSQTWLRQATGTGLFAEAFHDPVPVIQEIDQPVLALWGEYDRLTPPGESLATFQETFERNGHASYTLRIVPDADHRLHQTPDQGFTSGDEFAPGHVELVASWIDGLADGAPASRADPAPAQERHTVTIEPLAWYESPWLVFGAFGLFVVASAGYALVALVRRASGRRSPAVVKPARWLAAAMLLASFGTLVTFGVLMAAQVVGPVVAGRPLVWLAVQLLALAAVAGLVATGAGWWTKRADVARSEAVRLGLVVVAGLAFVPWALYWGLLLP